MRILIIYVLQINITIIKLDMESDFLKGKIKEDIYINFPNGTENIDMVYKGKLETIQINLWFSSVIKRVLQRVFNYLKYKIKMNRFITEACLLCNSKNSFYRFIC